MHWLLSTTYLSSIDFKEAIRRYKRYIPHIKITYEFGTEENIKLLKILIIILLIAIVSICIINRVFKKSLGKRQINKAKEFQIIIEEIHYAACYCKDNPSLIPRCISLLKRWPSVCNIPMPIHNYTPFLRACWNGCSELISAMIRNGANIDAITDAGEGGIYLATYCIIRRNEKPFSALKILLAAGLDINTARHDGYTALHLAASRGHTRLVCWLLAHGANPAPENRPSAADVAMLSGYPKTAEILRLPMDESI